MILANVPRSSGDDVDGVRNFSDEQVQMLVTNTQQMGSGLIMLGGASSFGAGGWTNTEVEKAMPVDFQIDNLKIAPVGALCLIMHAGEMAKGNHWQKVVARESIQALGNQDYCGLLQWSGRQGGDTWLWSEGFARVRGKRQNMLARLDRMTPGDMPEFDPSMRKAAAAFAKLTDAAIKHMIIISDGDPTPPKGGTLKLLTDQQPPVVVTTVAVGSHGILGTSTMQDIAKQTGGKYYKVQNAAALPRIYQREVRRLARPLVYQREQGFQPQIVGNHEIVRDISPPPPLTGFVLTSKKDHPLVEVLITSPVPSGERTNTILATWTYGLGRTVAWTTDTGESAQGWARQWKDWPDYQKFFSKMVRWSMRPIAESENFMLATDTTDGKVQVLIQAWDQEDEFLDFLNMTGSVVGPDMQRRQIDIRQVAPGRYLGEFEAEDPGSYMILVHPGRGQAPLRTGINVPYSAEYRDREENLALLSDIAGLIPTGGQPGMLIEEPGRSLVDPELVQRFNSFRHDLLPATSPQDVWHLLLLAGGCLFFFDVFFRRVQIGLGGLVPLVARVRAVWGRGKMVTAPSPTLARLQSRKAEMAGQLQQRRAATRFQPTGKADAPPSPAGPRPAAGGPPPQPGPAPPPAEQAAEEETYTSRLLKAKRKVWEDKHEKNQ